MITADPVNAHVAADAFGLDPLRPVSTTHHWVGANPRDYVKVARDDSILMAEAIAREAQVSAALGVPVRTGVVHGRVAMTTPALGTALPDGPGGPVFVAAALDALETLRRTRAALPSLPDGEQVAQRVLALTQTATDVQVRQWGQAVVTDAGPYCGSGPQVLVHTDAHRGNWVIGMRGLITLVDWESAAIASAEVDVAGLAISRLRAGDDAGVAACHRHVLDEATYRWALSVKAAEAGVWLARVWGQPRWLDWRARVEPLLNR